MEVRMSSSQSKSRHYSLLLHTVKHVQNLVSPSADLVTGAVFFQHGYVPFVALFSSVQGQTLACLVMALHGAQGCQAAP